jgi:prepilin-type processing-associated H-X9-DG protein
MRDSYPKIERVYPIVVLAGDIGHIESQTFRDFIEYCSNTWDHVIFVPGNREFYHNDVPYQDLWKAYEQFCSSYANVYFLDGHSLEVNGIMFFGTTMWTPIDPKWEDGKPRIRSFHQTIHCWDDLRSLSAFLEQYRRHPCKVIVTHFPITREHTCHPRYADQPEEKKRYFSANWLSLFPRKYLHGVWRICSGHTHHSYRIEHARGVTIWSNQLGYPGAEDLLYVPNGDLFDRV